MIKVLNKTDSKKIEKLNSDFINILEQINKKGDKNNSFLNDINSDILSKIARDTEEGCLFITHLLDIDLKRYKKITAKHFSEIFKCIVEALFLNISHLMDYFSGSRYADKVNLYLTL